MILSVQAQAGRIERAFDALEIYDYFKAKALFEDEIDDEVVPAAFGLSEIYYRNDNPFHDLDLAYKFINISFKEFKRLKPRRKTKLQVYGIDSISIENKKHSIILEIWKTTRVTKSVDEYNIFINKYTTFSKLDLVISTRNWLAFQKADSIGTNSSYREYYTTYPDSKNTELAIRKYQKLLYNDKTSSNTLIDYVNFVEMYPDSFYRIKAENKIYDIATKDKTLAQYHNFVKTYTDNNNINRAWKHLFTLSFTDFNDKEIRNFTQDYPNFPFAKDMLSKARVLRDVKLYKIVKDHKWGYVNNKGILQIEPKYAFENEFSNELALVANDNYIGYIDKEGKQVIEFKYEDGQDFINGVARVSKGDSIAMIDKSGREVLPFKYSYISTPNNKIVVAKKIKDDRYYYYDVYGNAMFENANYKFATPYNHGYSIVSDSGKYGVINIKGEIIIDLVYDKIMFGAEKQIRAASKLKYGVIGLSKKDTIIDFKYKNISSESEGKYAVFTSKKYGYVDTSGTKITNIKYNRYKNDTSMTAFNKGYAVTGFRGKYGIIDSLGNKIFPNIFGEIGDVQGFPIPVSKYKKWGYVKADVTLWSQYKYDYAGAFNNGTALISKKGKYGVIDLKKTIIIPLEYDYMRAYNSTNYIVSKDGKFGIINKENKMVLPLIYNDISPQPDNIARMMINGEYNYFDMKTLEYIYNTQVTEEEKKEEVIIN